MYAVTWTDAKTPREFTGNIVRTILALVLRRLKNTFAIWLLFSACMTAGDGTDEQLDPELGFQLFAGYPQVTKSRLF